MLPAQYMLTAPLQPPAFTPVPTPDVKPFLAARDRSREVERPVGSDGDVVCTLVLEDSPTPKITRCA